MKIVRQHRDDGGGMFIENHGLTNDFRFAAVAFLPCGIAQHGGARRRQQIFAGVEISPENRRDTQGVEKTV